MSKAGDYIRSLDDVDLFRFTRRFWGHVDTSGGPDSCWPWTGQVNEDGYGNVYGYTEEHKRWRRIGRSHQIAAWLKGLQPEAGQSVLHHCDNPRCCNPYHMFLGTQAENIADMCAKGRDRHPHGDESYQHRHPEENRGERNGRAKLTEFCVRNIRELAADGETFAELARRYGVSESTASGIVKRRLWRHVA